MLERYFSLSKHETTPAREVLAGVTTFLTMSYILFLQPAILSQDFAGNSTGLRPQAIFFATAVASGIATILMGIFARLPIALAPGMGQNYFFVTVVVALGSWQAGLGVVLIAGLIFLLLTLVGARKVVLDVMSPSMRSAIAVGIGAFITLIGFKNANVVVAAPSLVALNAANLLTVDSMIFWGGLLLTLVLGIRRVPGNVLIGIVCASIAALYLGKVSFTEVAAFPSLRETAVFQFSLKPAFTLAGLTYVIVFVFMDIFDTTGTLVAVSQRANLMDEKGELPVMREAMLSDAVGTVFGAMVGTSTVTSYIESATGVEQGGRTGLTAVTTGILFLLSLVFGPLVIAFGQYAPITAPAMVIVGAMMFRAVKDIDWSDETESIPAFLVILGIPLFFSIADGIALGLIVWPIVKIARGKISDVPLAAYVLALLLIAYFLCVRTTL